MNPEATGWAGTALGRKKRLATAEPKKYRGADNPANKKSPLTRRSMKLEAYKRPQRRGGVKSRRTHRINRWVPA